MISGRLLNAWRYVWMVLAILAGCVPDNNPEFPAYQNYFPLRGGDYRIYTVVETKITPFNNETTLQYEVKTLVTDSFLNSEGKYSYVISRLKRMSAGEDWSNLDTWLARANEQEVVVSEGNTPYVKLSFPVKKDRTWNGNAYNSEETDEFCTGVNVISCDLYSFGESQVSFVTSSGLMVQDVEEVIENNDPDLFTQYDVRKTLYALDVGMVKREWNVLNYCTQGTGGDCYGKQLVIDGLKLTMELKEYGRE